MIIVLIHIWYKTQSKFHYRCLIIEFIRQFHKIFNIIEDFYLIVSCITIVLLSTGYEKTLY